ncbi:zinc-binding metallopeptidase family protein [Ensifer sp.]|uniref:zinc-binding metallopeptidase family protein n=1 Tax=Ensifer sp. TaxID=1872086 RepID=UPI002E1347E1|nr:putative zinc-binding metallopeptidase [Ensifer sp.]
MAGLLETLADLIGTSWRQRDVARRYSRTFLCRCGSHVFFGNMLCNSCQSPLGYLPGEDALLPLDLGPQPGIWVAGVERPLLKYCGNRETPAQCNWMLEASEPGDLCIACRLNRTIPNLDREDNARYWGLLEAAKRRLVSQLLALGLPVKSKVDEDEAHGLMFDFLRSPPEGPRVLTGHADGLITVNIEEADSVERERMRLELHEPYRTLLGHFRHEVGHYYWDRLVLNGPWLELFRVVFGDERADYAKALQANYENGPPADWGDRYITSYASTHPWEDWAETWAHYLHMIDSLGTAFGFGLDAEDLEAMIEPFERDALYAPDDAGADSFLSLLNSWVEMTMVLNELARSLGQPDFYPFVMSKPTAAKLQFVHMVVEDSRTVATTSGVARLLG